MQKMAVENMHEHFVESVICGNHICKDVWQPRVGERLLLEREEGNAHDRFAVCLVKNGTVGGHVPIEVSQLYTGTSYVHGGSITCEVTGRRKHGKGLEVPCVYSFAGSDKLIQKMKKLTSSTCPNSCSY